jgi:sugar phosphate isomerase/epimerase
MWSEPILSAIEYIGLQGYPAVEIWAEHVWRDGEDPRSVAEALEAFSMQVSVHAPAGKQNLADFDPVARGHAIEQNLEAIELAAQIGARVVAVHPGHEGSSPEATVGLTVEALDILSRRAEGLGITVAVENMEKRRGEVFLMPQDVLRLIDMVGSRHLGLTLDVAHLCTAAEKPIELVHSMDRIDHVHLSDFEPGFIHKPLGTGQLDIAAWLDALVAKCGGFAVLEGHVAGEEREVVSANKSFLEKLGGSSLQIRGGARLI